MAKHHIKNPTRRKVRNRGFTPVRLQLDSGFYNGWIYKEGRIWIHCYFPSIGNRKVHINDRAWLTEV